MHEGHRQRMYGKLDRGEDLYDHEVLEILLYAACPRQNTNPVAHALLDRFCSLSEILKADVNELKSVDGVGDGIANFLRTVGLCAERTGSIEGAAVLKTFADCKNFVSLRFRKKTEEFLELYFMDKGGKVKRIYTYTNADRNKVSAPVDVIVGNLALVKPHGVLVAHNHINNSAYPSESDEIFTREIQIICNMNNVKLWDHVIYSENEIFSFKDSGKLDGISEKFSLTNVIKWIETSH